MTGQADSYRIVSPTLTVKAMRDSGYKDTAHALAELIDNSIDAEATLVEVFACESPIQLTARTTHRIDRIAVLDNGHGMEPEMLRRALKFGDGAGSRAKRIGRFGMGLPNSSLSQCTRVEVWSWTNGAGNASWTYLDLGEIKAGRDDVPEPTHSPLPDYWRGLSEDLGKTGTLVLWTGQLDRVNWHGATATLRHTEEQIGRVYRHFLNSGRVRIRMAPVRDGNVLDGVYYAAPNDPLYLMKYSSTPAPFHDQPMFTPWDFADPDRPGEIDFPVADKHGNQHIVTIRVSIARPEARRSDLPDFPWPESANLKKPGGDQTWGKHAGRNIGVSLVRERRELTLDRAWAIGYNPVERWWGVEVEFPQALDDVFGVTNNKQNATVFAALAGFDWEDEKDDDETIKAYKDRLAELGDARVPLIDLANFIKYNVLAKVRKHLKVQTIGTRPSDGQRYVDPADRQASNAIKDRQGRGKTGKTDRLGEGKTDEQKRQEQIENLTQRHHVPLNTAQTIVEESLEEGLLARWIEEAQDTEAFFGIDPMASMLQVIFNTEHVLHERLMSVIGKVPEDATPDELRDHLKSASTTFRLLLFSWARMEEEETDPARLKLLKDARRDWGSYARDFLEAGEQ